ncbi:MAG: hypothetical protein JRI49_08965 [Deltaproteobacteria bacterium]|nr:hypothetical protein [Deltaproteobacteria bacterium]
MKGTRTSSQSNTQKKASSPPISPKLLLEKIANLDGTVLLGKPEFKHLEEYLPERGVDEKDHLITAVISTFITAGMISLQVTAYTLAGLPLSFTKMPSG